MDPILVCGYPEGTSLGLAAAFEWLGQPYRLARVDMINDMKTAAYARLNGRQETPVLVRPDGAPLTESMAIALWLEARDTDRRISFDPKSLKADRMHQLMGFLNTGFTGAFSPLWAAMEMNPPNPALQETLRSYGRKSVIERHEKLEAMIGDEPYLAGDKPTFADAMFVGVARWAEFHEIDVIRFKRIQAHKQKLAKDPAVIFAHGVEIGEAPRGSGACKGYVAMDDVLAMV
ncbi:MAG: glutathione S-transferase family protein [Burkholderiales bacterium]|nr:MAG: glutathione S-transferase family protein [Burkholderiales bacterium]